MGKPMILVSSITYAMKGRDILFQHGIKSYVERMPHNTGSVGCGYSIYVPNRTDEAEQILIQSGIHVNGRVEREGAI
ncbi:MULTISPECIES: putative Se/S carrier-like protein [Eubacteriales]|uniref:putative Se/S carrier-like protein n=1 Tax=Eubacteriales TaxID=186802 RepID=UPI001FA6B908|nr:putative Se/S carrier-like protein [Anaeromassilibacillus senegalensis]